MNNIKRIVKKIRDFDEIVVARHVGPDPDAIASQMALKEAILLTFPEKKVYAVGVGVSRFKHFGSLDKLEDNLCNPLLIVLDTPNINRIDGIDFDTYKEVIKIDHHPYEDKMGDLEIVDINASSTAEIITDIVLHSKLSINDKVAENLYMGIVSDSERFLFLHNPKTFELVSELIKKTNIDFTSLYDRLYERPLSDVRFEGYISENMIVTDNKFGYLLVPNKVIEEYKVDLACASILINSFNYIKEIIAWSFIVYDPNKEVYKVNIRSRGPVINDLAAKYNGGGHPMASGARIKEKEDIDTFITDMDKLCKEYNENN